MRVLSSDFSCQAATFLGLKISFILYPCISLCETRDGFRDEIVMAYKSLYISDICIGSEDFKMAKYEAKIAGKAGTRYMVECKRSLPLLEDPPVIRSLSPQTVGRDSSISILHDQIMINKFIEASCVSR